MNLFVPKLSKKRRQSKVFVPQPSKERRNTNTYVPQLSKGRGKTNLFVPKLSKERRKTKVFVPQPWKEQRKTNTFVLQLSKERRRTKVFLPQLLMIWQCYLWCKVCVPNSWYVKVRHSSSMFCKGSYLIYKVHQQIVFTKLKALKEAVPRRLFFTALQWIAIAQSPKLHQKNQL